MITKPELVDMIAEESGLTKKDTKKFIDAFMTVVSDTLVKEEPIFLKGFGAFEIRQRAAREYINPTTKEMVLRPTRKMLGFKASQLLKNRLNNTESEV